MSGAMDRSMTGIADETLIVQEVATRDGFQIEPVFVETAEKIRLIDALSEAGFSRIEVSSFVSPKAVPALRDAAEVFAGIRRRPGTVYVPWCRTRRGPSGRSRPRSTRSTSWPP